MSVVTFIGLIAYGMFIGVVLGAPIGPINVEIINRGIRAGFLNGWLVGLGALSVDTVFAALVVSGLAPVADSPRLTGPLFLAGSVMLGFVAWTSLRNALNARDVPIDGTVRRGRSYATGALIAAFSPMGIVYWLSVGAALVAEAVERAGRVGAPVLVVGVFLGLLVWVTFVSVLAQVARRFVSGRGMRWITGISGVLMCGFAVWFLIQGIAAIRAL